MSLREEVASDLMSRCVEGSHHRSDLSIQYIGLVLCVTLRNSFSIYYYGLLIYARYYLYLQLHVEATDHSCASTASKRSQAIAP